MAVTTSVVVQFSSNTAGASLSAEVDGREDGLNGGATSFRPGDGAYFLVFGSTGVVIDEVVSSAGTLTYAGTGLFDMEEWLTFTDSKEASFGKPPATPVSYEWFGNNLGVVAANGSSATVDVKGVGTCKVTSKASYHAYRLNSPAQINGKSEFQIVVLVKGHDTNA